tara:strand:+ start:595 stop:804 length:210 start_codon:yes stop_codon:yes gene_type:complete
MKVLSVNLLSVLPLPGRERQVQMILLLKNLAILGGLLQIAIEAPRTRTARALAKRFHEAGALRLGNLNT